MPPACTCFAFLAIGLMGAGCGASPNLSQYAPDATREAREGAPTADNSTPERPYRVVLVACEAVEPLGFEETLPDGRVIESPNEPPVGGVRLYLRVESFAERPAVVAMCSSALAIVEEGAPRPYCSPSGADDWLPLPPHATLLTYPTIHKAFPATGTFTEDLRSYSGHSPTQDWPDFKPNPVSFELTSEGCRPVVDAE